MVQIATNCKKIILNFFVLSIALARTGTILPIASEITPIKIYDITIRIKTRICKRSNLIQ